MDNKVFLQYIVTYLWSGVFVCADFVTMGLRVALLGAHVLYIAVALDSAVMFFVEVWRLTPRSIGMLEILDTVWNSNLFLCGQDSCMSTSVHVSWISMVALHKKRIYVGGVNIIRTTRGHA